MTQSFVTALDIGSHHIKAAVSEIKKDGKIALLKIIKMPSQGVRKGVIDDVSDATRSIHQTLNDVKQFDKRALKNIYVSIGSNDVKVHSSRGIVAVSRADSEIQRDDIERVIEAAQAVKLKNNRIVLHSIIQEYVVDDVGDIRDPMGMVGNRLEANSLIVDAFEPNVRTLIRSIETAGGSVSGLIFSPLAAARSVLSKNQKELGVLLIDIGFGKTGMAVYEENKLLHAKVFPFGSGNITNDLAIGLKMPIHAAENVKMSLGMALSKEAPAREMVDLKKFDAGAKKTISRRAIADIIEDRLAEIFEAVDNELTTIGKSVKLPGGVVLTGGGSKMPLIVDLAKRELKLNCQIGIPDISEIDVVNSELAIESEDPELSAVFGLLMSGEDQMRGEESSLFRGGGSGFMKRFLKNFIP